MNNPFTPPTDNLFKFIAITGLLSMTAGLILLIGYKEKPDELALKYLGEEKLLKKEIDILSGEIKTSLKKELSQNKDSNNVNYKYLNFSDSITADFLFSLPLREQKAFKTLILKREKVLHQRELINYYESKAEKYSDYYVWLLLGGEVVTILGFWWWWVHVQKPSDKLERVRLKLEQNKVLSEDLWKENCQSCLKSLLTMKQRGKEDDGSISKHYCSNCYTDGVFTEPELNYEEAYKRLKKECEIRKYNRKKRSNTLALLSKALRWRGEFEW
jgi:hypothetical protein